MRAATPFSPEQVVIGRSSRMRAIFEFLDVVSRSEYFNNAINSPQIEQPAYTAWDLGLTYKSADQKWTLSAIGKNLSDERILSAGFSDTRFLGTSEGVLSRGREWAVTIKRSF